jgi:hypothetical protein
MFMRVTDIWSTIITHYNTCALTYRRDKLPAINGIARCIHERTSLLFHCGLFFDRGEMIPLNLLWMPSREPVSYGGSGPTWSWAAYDGAVEKWDFDIDKNSGYLPRITGNYTATVLELVQPHSGPEYDPRFGPAEDPTVLGALVMEGRPKLAKRSLSRLGNLQNAYADAGWIQIPLHGWPGDFDCNERSYAILESARCSLTRPEATAKFKGWVCFDQADEEDEPEIFCILPIVEIVRFVSKQDSTAKEGILYTAWRFLAVQRRAGVLGPADLTLQRVVYGEIFGDNWFDDARLKKFTLV